MQTEARFQQDCFIWFNNTFPLEIGRLILLFNNPQNSIQGAKLKGMGLRKGKADFLYLMPYGKDIFIELKTEIGIQGKFQIWFESIVKYFGNEYYLINDLQAFKALIQRLGRLPHALPVMPLNRLKIGK